MTSPLDIRNDAPGALRTEAMGITLKFDRTGPSTGRISWNIPRPSTGCTAETQAYNGIVITVDTTSNNTTKLPVNGTVYSADPTVDQNLFAGDNIGTSKVVGAFYDDRFTTFFDISGLRENTPYYVSGFPVDAQNRYYREGVHAYSLDFHQDGTAPTSGTQVVVFDEPANNGRGGVQLTDVTGLEPGTEYSFTIERGLVPKPNRPVGSQECVPVPFSYTIKVNGDDASTYDDLLKAINAQLQIVDNPPMGATSPNTNAYYLDASTTTLYLWDGATHVKQDVMVQSQTPSAVVDGSYWYNTETKQLNKRVAGVWVTVTVITYKADPTKPDCENVYWYNGTNIFKWSGNAWVKQLAYNQNTDPSLFQPAPCGSFWYNSSAYGLFAWDDQLQMWTATNAVQYSHAPNQLVDGDLWFDDTNKKTFSWNAVDLNWVEQVGVRIAEAEPTIGVDVGTLWYNPTTMVMKVRNSTNTAWNDKDVIVYPTGPQQAKHWWNTVSDTMNVWDDAAGVWNEVEHFFQQDTDPTEPPAFNEGDIWFNVDTGEMYYWQNNCFLPVDQYITYPTNPRTTLPDGIVWHDTVTDQWYVKTSTGWDIVDVTYSTVDTTMLAVGTLWYDPVTKALQAWNGISWIALTYSTKPLTPQKGDHWFNLTTSKLMEWDGYAWVYATPRITAEFNCFGNMIFTDTSPGSLSWVRITDVDLFDSLTLDASIKLPSPGSDGVSSEPLYEEIGVGTDGTNDERLKLMTEIRYALGYPTVDVEIQPEQLNLAIDMALQTLREHSSIAYSRGFFFLQVQGNTQRYLLTNKVSGMNKIVEVLGVHRLTSAFLSSAHGAGVYGQIVLQHLYNMGTFDLLSYHIMTEYTKNLEILFAGRITYTWNEQTRELHIHHRFPFAERLCLVEASVERSEQQLLTDRVCRPWLRKWATAEAMLMLANSRGKFASLPGAGGSVQLNASDLRQQATTDKESCMNEIFDYVVDTPEEWGIQSSFTFG